MTKFITAQIVLLLAGIGAFAQTVLTITPGPTTQTITINVPAVQVVPPPVVVTPPPVTQPTQPPIVPATVISVADWDTVPYQAPAGTLNVSVVAWHINGVTSVGFKINGGAEQKVTAPSLNPQTNVIEYWTPVAASTATVDATIYANGGNVTKLPQLPLNQPAKLLIIRGQTLSNAPANVVSALQAGKPVWYDNCTLSGSSRFDKINWNPGFWTGTKWVNFSYFTGCKFSKCMDGPRGALLSRNCSVEQATGGYSEVQTIINCTARDINAVGWGTAPNAPHPDVAQYYSSSKNGVIIYGLVATDTIGARGISWAEGMTNGVIVNCNVKADASCDFGRTLSDVLIKNSNLNWALFDPGKSPIVTNFVIDHSSSISNAGQYGAIVR